MGTCRYCSASEDQTIIGIALKKFCRLVCSYAPMFKFFSAPADGATTVTAARAFTKRVESSHVREEVGYSRCRHLWNGSDQ